MRLQALDEAIRKDRYPNCLSFSRDWEVSQKTIQRDIEFIKYVLGASIEYDRGKQGYYYTDSNWFLPALAVSEGELLALALGAQAAKLYQGTPLAEKLDKILAKIVDSLPDIVSIAPDEIINNISFIGHSARPINTEVWKIFVRATCNHMVLNVTYRAEAKPDTKSYQLHPYHLANIKGDWYVFGVIPPYDNVIQFALSRFEHVETTKESFKFSAREDVKERIQKAFGQFVPTDNEPIYKVCVTFDIDISHRITARQWHPTQKLNLKKDGSGTLEFPAASLEETMRWVLGWGRHVKVLEPKELKNLVADEIQNMGSRLAP